MEYCTEIKDALMKKALGYDYEEKIMVANKDGSNGRVKIMKKHIPPDPKAAEVIMKMIMNGYW